MYCKKCGKELPDGSKFCGVCGERQDVQSIQQNMSEGAQLSLKGPVLLMCMFVVIGMLIFGGYKYMNQPKKIIVGVWEVVDDDLNKTGDKIEFRKDGTLLNGSTIGYWSFVEKDRLRLTSWSEEHTYECSRINGIFAQKELMLREGKNIIYLEKE